MRDFLDRDSIDPGVDLLTVLLFPPYFLFLPYKFAHYLSAAWEQVEQELGYTPGDFFVHGLLFMHHIPLIQGELNRLWECAELRSSCTKEP